LDDLDFSNGVDLKKKEVGHGDNGDDDLDLDDFEL